MKKSKVLYSFVLLALVLIISFLMDPSSKATTEEERPVVGVLQFVSHPALDEIYRGVKAGLAENGYPADKVTIAFQNGQGDQSKLQTMSQQLAQKADVLVGIATPAAQALANTTQELPIVLGAVSDPVSAGLVKNEEKPGGLITGVSDKSPVDAQMKLIQDLLPQAKTMGILYSSAEDNSRYQAEQIQAEAEKAGLKVKTYPVPSTNEIAQTVQVLSQEVDVLYIPTDNTIASAMQTVVSEADKAKLPIIPSVDTMVSEGGLATVGINQFELGKQTGKMAAEILQGADPGEMPIYTFSSGDIILNEAKAAQLGITIPQAIKEKAKLVSND